MQIDPVRDLPQVNMTEGKELGFESYYLPSIRKRAVGIFGPFMKKWNFDFPVEWGEIKIPISHVVIGTKIIATANKSFILARGANASFSSISAHKYHCICGIYTIIPRTISPL